MEPVEKKNQENQDTPAPQTTEPKEAIRTSEFGTDRLAKIRERRLKQQQSKLSEKAKEEEQNVEEEHEYDYLAEVLSEVERSRAEKQSLLQPQVIVGASLTTTENSVVITTAAERNQQELAIYTTYSNIPAFQPSQTSAYETGLYIGKKPYIPLSYKNRMGQRLNKESSSMSEQGCQHWLDLTGDLNYLNEPLKPLFERPSQWYDPNAEYLQTNFSSPTSSDSTILEEKVYQLEIDLISLKFYDHPLFGKEQMLASQLDLLYEEYKERQKLSLATFYNEKLSALEEHLEFLKNHPKEPATARESTQLRKSKLSLRRSLSSKELGAIEEDDSQNMEKQNQLRAIIRQTRILRDQEENNDVLIVKKLIAIWEHIKLLRQQQGFAMTTHTLAIKKYRTEMEEDVVILEKQLQSELNELREDHQTRFAQQLEEYRKQVRMVEYTKQLDASKINPEDLPPIPQFKEFDEDAARRTIIERYKQTKRKPGTPVLIPVVTYAPTPETTGGFPPLEINRRFEISRSQFYCKLFVNNRFVTKTKTYTLTPDFVIELNELFTLQLVKWPDSIKLQLVSLITGTAFTLSKESVMAELFLKIPVTETIKRARESQSQQAVFSMGTSFTPTYDASLPSNGQDDVDLELSTNHFISGKVEVNIGWNQDDSGNIMAPVIPSHIKKQLLEDSLPTQNIESTQKLKEWLTSFQYDPNDPRNYNIQHLLKRDKTAINKNAYSVTSHDDDLALPDTAETSRMKLLQLRKENKIQRLPVPLVDSEIRKTEYDLPDKPAPEETLPAAKAQTNRQFLQEVRAAQIQQVVELQSKPEIRLSDILKPLIVQELNIGEILSSIFRPRRKLRPERKERPPVTVISVQECNLVIQIVRAFNIPKRRTDTESEDEVNPFVEVCFEQKQDRTQNSIGANPQWHETIVFPFTPPGNDFSSANLQVISEDIVLNVFDEILVDLPKDDRNVDEIHQRKERRWLGTCKIPFNAVYSNMKIEGTFKLNKPLASLTHLMDTSRNINEFGLSSSKDTLIGIYITLDPPLQPQVMPIHEDLPSQEEAVTMKYASQWKQNLQNTMKSSKKYSNRKFEVFCIDLSGKSALITRYIRPQNPPAEFGNSEEIILHYVSMIPFLEDSVTFVGRTNVWSTSKQFLAMRAGDWEEHAVLLCNYFLFMKKEAWVVLGSGIEGDMAYVLVKSDNLTNPYTLYDPCSGESYSLNDLMCPLKDINSIFNQTNIWANVQDCEISKLKWDLNNNKIWVPFFNAKFSMPNLLTVQLEKLDYKPPVEDAVKTLETEIEEAVMEKIKNSRKRFVTRWNRPLAKILKGFLVNCEKYSLTKTGLNEEEHIKELIKFSVSYTISGSPINLKYTDTEEIANKVFQLNLHKNEDPKSEFAVAAYVAGYPNKIYSVWIYIASICPKL